MAVRRYAGPAFFRTIALGARFTGLYLRLALWLGLGAILVAVVGVTLNILGLGVLNAYIGLVLLAALAVVWFIPPMDLAVLFFGAVRAQPGNTPGLSTDDAKKGAAESWAEYKKAFLNIGFYLAVALMFLSFIPMRQAPWMVGFILFAVLFYVLVSEYYNIPMSWAKPIFKWSGVAAITFGFAALLPPAAWNRVNLPHPSTWGFSEADDLAAEYSRVKFEREEADRSGLIKSAINKARKGQKLTEAEEKALETRTAVGTVKPLVHKASEAISHALELAKKPFTGQAAGEVNKTSDAPATAKPASKAPAPAATPTSAVQTAKVVWQGVYTPSQGVLSIGVPPHGSYRVVGSGIRYQNFIEGGGVHRQYAMDKDGRLVQNGNATWTMGNPKGTEARTPFPHRPYGALIVLIGDRKEWAANGQCFSASGQEEVKFGTNVPDHPDNRSGSGSLELRVEMC